MPVFPINVWWNESFLLRRRVLVSAPNGTLPLGHNIDVPLAVSEFIAMNTLRPDFQDLQIIYKDPGATPRSQVLDRNVSLAGVTFPLFAALEQGASAEYWVYYCSPQFVNASDLDVAVQWPIEIPYSSPLITYTRPGEFWDLGRSDTRGAVATMRFFGTRVKLVSELSPYGGLATLFLDGTPMATVDLYSVLTQEEASVFESPILPDGEHKVQLVVEGTKSPMALLAGVNIRKFFIVGSYTAVVDREESLTTNWATYSGGFNA